MDDAAWRFADDFVSYLDAHSGLPSEQRVLVQALKLQEESGEVASAVIGALGANPRKGPDPRGWDGVRAEACDTAITALVLLTHLCDDPAEYFAAHLRGLIERLAAAASPSAADEQRSED
jgi:hypothetical protein